MLSEEELAGVPLLVFCNKQDIDGALKPEEISEQLGLAGGEKGRDWSVRGSCAIKGEGIEEGLDWCVTNVVRASSITNELSGWSMRYKRNKNYSNDHLVLSLYLTYCCGNGHCNTFFLYIVCYRSARLDFHVSVFAAGWYTLD